MSEGVDWAAIRAQALKIDKLIERTRLMKENKKFAVVIDGVIYPKGYFKKQKEAKPTLSRKESND